MTKRSDTALRILTTTLAGGFGGWLWTQDFVHYLVGAIAGFAWGVVMPYALPHLKSAAIWFIEQFERI